MQSIALMNYGLQFFSILKHVLFNHSSGPGTTKPDTFIPLQNMPPMNHESFHNKERRRRFRDEVDVVQSLEDWRPATPLLPPPHEDIGRK